MHLQLLLPSAFFFLNPGFSRGGLQWYALGYKLFHPISTTSTVLNLFPTTLTAPLGDRAGLVLSFISEPGLEARTSRVRWVDSAPSAGRGSAVSIVDTCPSRRLENASGSKEKNMKSFETERKCTLALWHFEAVQAVKAKMQLKAPSLRGSGFA